MSRKVTATGTVRKGEVRITPASEPHSPRENLEAELAKRLGSYAEMTYIMCLVDIYVSRENGLAINDAFTKLNEELNEQRRAAKVMPASR